LRWLSIVSEARPRPRYDAEFQGRARSPDIELQGLPCPDLAKTFRVPLGRYRRKQHTVTGHDSITYLETRLLCRQTAPEFLSLSAADQDIAATNQAGGEMSTRERVLNQNKVAKLTDIGKLIKDGDSVAVGGAWLSSHPMALVRQIIRSGMKNLHVMTILGSVDIDMLVGAGCVDKLLFSFVSMEAYGLPPSFRRAVEKGNLKLEETSGLAIIIGFEATGRGVPFLPYRGPSGSDFLKQRPDFYKEIKCPFTGEQMMFKAKPARNVVKVLALKNLKTMVS
jgi:acyl CoA:acetate/3-ketoacid CoA transferase alpha subunit